MKFCGEKNRSIQSSFSDHPPGGLSLWHRFKLIFTSPAWWKFCRESFAKATLTPSAPRQSDLFKLRMSSSGRKIDLTIIRILILRCPSCDTASKSGLYYPSLSASRHNPQTPTQSALTRQMYLCEAEKNNSRIGKGDQGTRRGTCRASFPQALEQTLGPMLTRYQTRRMSGPRDEAAILQRFVEFQFHRKQQPLLAQIARYVPPQFEAQQWVIFPTIFPLTLSRSFALNACNTGTWF